MKRDDLVLGTMIAMAFVPVMTILLISGLQTNRVDSLQTSVVSLATGDASCLTEKEE